MERKKRLRSRNSYLESLSDEKKKTRNYHRRRSKQERRKRCKARRIAKPSYYGKPSYFRRYRKPKSNHYLPKKNVVPAKKTTNCITTFTSAYCELYDNCKIDHTTKEQLHKLIDNCCCLGECLPSDSPYGNTRNSKSIIVCVTTNLYRDLSLK